MSEAAANIPEELTALTPPNDIRENTVGLSSTAILNGEQAMSLESQSESLSRTQRLVQASRGIGRVAMRSAQTAFVAAELNPIINEGSRYSIFLAAEGVSHSPLMGALSFGLSTFVVEEAGALASASLFNTPASNRFFEALNETGKKLRIPMDKKVPTKGKIAATYVGGSVVGMALEQREDPTRTVAENRRYGLWTSTWLAGVCAVQGALMAEGINVGLDHPGGAAIGGGVVAAAAAGNVIRKRVSKRGLDKRIVSAQEAYASEIDTFSSAQRSGIGDEEIAIALQDKTTVYAEIQQHNEKQMLPVLVPTKALYWYNQDMLGQLYPDKNTYFFTQLEGQDTVAESVCGALQEGKVMLAAETPVTEKLVDKVRAILGEDRVVHESLHDAFLNQYVGETEFISGQSYKVASNFVDQYKHAVESGLIENDPENGASIVDSIEGEDADRLWEIYEKPFDDISTSSPINAGFDKEGFYKALKDPTVVKVINKHDGAITTMAFFETNLKNASWLNEKYFSRNYPEAYASKNILLFLGIVSDENKRGNAYSVDLINLLLKVGKMRETKVLITFECNEVSSHYLPQIVDGAINGSGEAKVTGLNKPVSQTKFTALRLK